jgi:polysaccharide pyruvyl transferase WcaK-like protein
MNPEDKAIAQRIAGGGVEIVDTDVMTAREVQLAVGRAGLLISMRLHPVIFASNVATPAIALSYAAKVKAFCDQMGLGDWLIDLEQPDWAQAVLAKVDAADAAKFRAALAAHRPAMLGSVEQAFETLFSWFPKYEQSAAEANACQPEGTARCA